MKRNFYLLLVLPLLLLSSCSGGAKNADKTIQMNEPTITSEDISWINNYCDNYENIISDDKISSLNGLMVRGEYYKAGLMGHRHCVKFGNKFSLFCFVAKKFEETYDTSEYSVIPGKIYNFESNLGVFSKAIMLTEKVSYGEYALINNKIFNGNYDTKETAKMSGFEKCLGEPSLFYIKNNDLYNSGKSIYEIFGEGSSIFIPGKKNACWAQMWCCLDFDIAESYTEEQTLSGWKIIENTITKNYTARAVLGTYDSVYYDDGTYGIKYSDGTYNEYKTGTIKNWDFSVK